MIIVCPSCQAKYKFDEEKLGERPRAKTRCAKCGGTIEIENPILASMTLPPGTLAGTAAAGAAPSGTTTQVPVLGTPAAAAAPAPAAPASKAAPAMEPPVRKPGGAPAGTITGRGIE